MESTLIADRFRIQELVGTGAVGRVFRAIQDPLDRLVALKLLDPDLADDPRARRRFFREARAAARLTHPHVVQIHDFGETDDFQLFLAMEWVPGGSMARWREHPPPLEVLLRACDQLLDGLAAAHGRAVLHRNLKPENVLLHGDPDAPDRVLLADFGMGTISDVASSPQDPVSTWRGNPHYAAPEQIRSDHTPVPETDVYAVGVLLYELLGGAPPFAGDAGDVMRQHLEKPPPELRPRAGYAVSGALRAVVERALRKEPERRYRSAAELRQALRDAVDADDGAPAREPARPRASTTLVGRDAELRRMLRVARTARDRPETHVVLLVGRTGTGKTSLAESLGHELVQFGDAARIRTRCSEDGLANAGFAAVLEELLDIRGLERAQARRRLEQREAARPVLGGADLEDVLDDLRPPVADTLILELDEGSGGRASRFARILRAAAEERPLLVLIDDLQRAPMDDLEVLQHLLALDVGDPRPLLVVATLDAHAWRREAPHHQLIDRLQREHRCVHRVEIEPLDEVSCEAMLAQRLDAGPAFARAVVSQVGTNPRIALAVAELAIASGHTHVLDGRVELIDADALEGQVPDDVRSLLRARIDEGLASLPDGPIASRALIAAAVWGERFEPTAVAELAVRAELVDDPAPLHRAFDHLVGVGLLEFGGSRAEDTLAFPTRLLRREVLDLLRASTRRRLHREAAALLERAPERGHVHGLKAIAHHLFAAGERDEGRVYLQRAAENAELGWMLDDARRLYRELLEDLGPDAARGDVAAIRLALGRVLARQGRRDEAREQLLDLPECDDDAVAAAATILLGEMALTLGNTSEASAWLMLGRERMRGFRAGDADEGVLPWLRGEWVLLEERLLRSRGDLERRIDHLRAALDTLPDGVHRMRAQERLAMALTRSGSMDEGVRLLDELEGSLAPDAPPGLMVELVLDRAILADIRGDDAEARTRYDEVLRRARDAGDPERISQALVGLAELARSAGELDAAEAQYRDALAIQRRLGHRWFTALTLINLGMVALARDDLDEATRRLDQVADLGADVAHPEVAVAYAFCRALVAGRRGELEEARSELYRFQAVNARVHWNEPDIARALEELAGIFGAAGEPVYADELRAQAVQMWEQLGRPDRARDAQGAARG